jgi:hypothetical protein
VAIGNVNGYGGVSPLTQRPQRVVDPGVDAPAFPQRAPGQVAPTAPAETGVPAGGEEALPVQAPPGTDPELWSLLTSEERRFFSKLHETGPLTYGPRTANTPPGLLRGGRFDRTV